jgi:hypothetical protein
MKVAAWAEDAQTMPPSATAMARESLLMLDSLSPEMKKRDERHVARSVGIFPVTARCTAANILGSGRQE